jgi:hypothetical protein
MEPLTAELVLDRMVNAVQAVRERLLRSTAALEAARIPYVVIGGNAVAVWVERADQGGVRNTPNVDILVRRTDFDSTRTVLETAGFIHQGSGDRHFFLSALGQRERDSVRIYFANEKIRPESFESLPDVEDFERARSFRVIKLEPLVRMKLASLRNNDAMHIRDLIGVGLVDDTWCDRLPSELAERLRGILATPEG